MSRPRSLASRTRAYVALTTGLALVVAFAVFSAGWSAYVVDRRTSELARQVVALARAEGAEGQVGAGREALRQRLLSIESGLMGATLYVTSADGSVERSSAENPPATIPLDRLGKPASDGVRTASVSDGDGYRVLVVAAPVGDGRWLVALERLSEIRAAQSGILALAAVAIGIALLVSWVVGGLFAHRLVRPLRTLEAGAERMAAGEFGTQVAEEGDAETVSLARLFNRMSRRVLDAYDAQRAFVADVSHEIRTPLTSIRGWAEALLDGTVTDEAGARHALVVIRDESGRIVETAQTLLSLAEVDAAAVELDRSAVPADFLSDGLRGRFVGAAADRGLALELHLASGVAPLADRDRLLQAASALVANAVRHASTTVEISTELDGERWRLLVDDDGPGVPEADREAVFERFRRLDRSRAASSGGTGLGLAICRRLVELMGGEVSVGSSPLGGARFVIDLPAAGPEA